MYVKHLLVPRIWIWMDPDAPGDFLLPCRQVAFQYCRAWWFSRSTICEKISQAQRNTWFTTLLPVKSLSRDLTVGCELGSERTLSLYTWFSVWLESGEDTLAKTQCLQTWVTECFPHGAGLGWMGEEESYGLKSKANWILEATVHGSGNAVILAC